MDPLTPEQRRKCMSRIKSKNTSIETLLRKALWKEGIRYRKNYDKLPGKPDIAITKHKLAIFCDGEFWHGKSWNLRKERLSSNRDYWITKIERNMNRDFNTDKELHKLGWSVLHFWGNDIVKKIDTVVNEVKEKILEIMAEQYRYEQPEPEFLIAAEDTPNYLP